MTSDTPDYKCLAYQEQEADLCVARDCYVGTKAVRAKTTQYLPQFPAEDNDSYTSRLGQSVFFNAFKRTIQGLTGLVFRKNLELGEDIDATLKAHLENVDNQGTHIDVFAKNILEAGLRDGHTYIFVDMPKPEGVTNLAQERAAALRPYWVHYLKDQVINWRTEEVNGQIILTQVTIEECKIIAAGRFEEKEVKQYRVLVPGGYFLYEVEEGQKGQAPKVTEIEAGTTSLDYIPLFAFYADKQGYFCSQPPLLDLALENLRHYRLRSDLDNIMHVCNVPILAAMGRTNPEDPLTISGSVVDLPLEGDLKYTEHSGAAIGAAQKELEQSQSIMASLGLMLLSDQPKPQMTATESSYKNQSELSTLSGVARSLQDALEAAFAAHADYLRAKPGSIEVNKDFGIFVIDPQMLQTLSAMEAESQYKLEWVWDLMERGGMMPPGVEGKEREAAAVELKAERKAKQDIGTALMNFDRGQTASPDLM
jgi:hypothetical protein